MGVPFYVVILLLAVSAVGVWGSRDCGNCGAKHPQQKFCAVEWVFRVRVIISNPAPLPGDIDLGYYNNPYISTEAVLISVFKNDTDTESDQSEEVVTELPLTTILPDESNLTTMIEIWTPSSFCGVYFEANKEYVLGGNYRKTPHTGEWFMMTTSCNWVQQWDDLTPENIEGIEGKYQDNCGRCEVLEMMSLSYLDVNTLPGGSGYDNTQSGLWTPFQDCYYNPLTAQAERVEDCETLYSFCKRKDNECSWEMNNAYLACFDRREITMITKQGGRAITNRRDCRLIESRRMRRKCIKLAARNREDTIEIGGDAIAEDT